MSTPFDATLTLEFKRSPSLIAALSIMHIGALGIVAIVPMHGLVRAALMLFALVSATRALLHHGRLRIRLPRTLQWLAPRVVAAIEWDSAGNWSIRYASAPTWLTCELREHWWQPWLVILRLYVEPDGRCRSVLIPADALAPDEFRRLRARLRLQTAAA